LTIVTSAPLKEGCFPFSGGSDRDGVGEAGQVLPFSYLCGPGVPRHSERRDHQNAADLEAVEQKIEDGRQADHRLPKTHVQENRGDRMRLDVVDGVFLVVMRFEVHPASLRSVTSVDHIDPVSQLPKEPVA
jgi:hypothetical protein